MAEKAEAVASPQVAKPESGAKARPIKTLPTDRIKFDKQLDLLRAYAAISGPTLKSVSNKDVAGVVEMVASTVSISNKFFSEMGFLLAASDGGYTPASDVVSYVRAYEWKPETAAYKLAPTILRTWFAERLVPKLRYRQMDEAEAITDLAEEAAASQVYQNQLKILLDYLTASGIIVRENGRVNLGPQANAVASGNGTAATTAGVPDAPRPETAAPPKGKGAAVSTVFNAPTEGVVEFHVSVRVDMSEFKGWQGDRIAAFFGGIAQVLAAKGKIEEDAST
ncbi:MAG: hypothetical protein WD773_05830 [Gemmatimonadales bacterium]